MIDYEYSRIKTVLPLSTLLPSSRARRFTRVVFVFSSIANFQARAPATRYRRH
jgi:hypothetical protein